MKHLIGYSICLAFTSVVLTFLGFSANLTSGSEAQVGAIFDALETHPDIGNVIHYTLDLFGTPFTPMLAAGDFLALVFSPVGATAVLLYLLVSWILPAR